jgi:hypothetical protein
VRNTNNIYRFILVGFLGTILILLALFGSTTFADSLRGYEVMEQYSSGGSWNHLQYPSVDTPYYDYYVAWWSPGQWVLPYFLKFIFHISSVQLIQFLMISSCLIAAIYGYFLLFKRLGFSITINLLSLICITTNQLFYWHSLMYYGGDLFLLALSPYFLIVLLQQKFHQSLRSTLLIFLVMSLGLFFKNTYLFYMLSTGIFLLFSSDKSTISIGIKRYLLLGFGVLTLLAVFYFVHVSKGQTPGTAIDHEGYNDVPNNWIGDLTYSLGSPVGIFSRISFVIQKGLSSIGGIGNILQIFPFLLTLFFLIDYQAEGRKGYRHLMLYFCLPFLLIFVPLYLSDRSISYEMRHFAPIAFVFTPGLIEWLFQRLKSTLVYVIILLISLFDIGLYVQSFRTIERSHVMWKDLKVERKDATLLKAIDQWDSSTKNGLLILEDYWMPSIAARNNDKYVLTMRKGNLTLVSGMELSQPDVLNLADKDLKKYTSLLLITRNNSKLVLPHSDFDHENTSQVTEEFQLQLFTRKDLVTRSEK